PPEEIGLNEADTGVRHSFRREPQHLGRAIDGCQRAGVVQQLSRPAARNAGQLQHVAGRPKILDDLCELARGRVEYVGAEPGERSLGVLRRSRAVVRELFGEQPLEILLRPAHRLWLTASM